ncbi:GNAT family N-acetyltransferase [Rhizobium sp. NRK18]|uniref:GNAT family N-acetyltransferase n=1 Tax=Rhizobium sp. NRK18 TaxID=2964667 RepID=UPI0021C2ED00|nr:GNAT family N-acetyltransferase [Rhizobium sp. NRK18]MCQ2005607.1 GNAT family N-acetyltransferase [Rhizobium sp. NRK18]
MPFGYFDEAGRCVANFSAFTIPLMINGRVVKAAGYQSGAVRPEFRGAGLYRDLMRRAFDWAAESGHEIGILLTDKPPLYEPYGFQSVPQHRFSGPMPETAFGRRAARPLDINNGKDIALLSKLLDNRQPVSQQFAPARQKEMFLLNCHFDAGIRLTLIEELDCVAAWKVADDGALQLLDLVCQNIPPVERIVGALNPDATRLEVFFPIDRLDWDGVAVPHKGYCDLMISGLPAATLPEFFMLSPLAEF